MDLLLLLLRIVHVGGAVLWAGGAVMFLLFVAPTINAVGPSAQPVMAGLLKPRRLPAYFAIVATLTVLAGAALFWRDTGGLQSAVLGSGFGTTFGIGGLAGLVAWVIAVVLVPRAVVRIGAVGAELRAEGVAPSAELVARMAAAQRQLRQVGLALLTFLAIAIVLMSVGRYIP